LNCAIVVEILLKFKYRRQEKLEQLDTLAMRCRTIFERLRPQLMETHYSWHIAIDADTEQYLIDRLEAPLSQVKKQPEDALK
jgi:hypothetical protein